MKKIFNITFILFSIAVFSQKKVAKQIQIHTNQVNIYTTGLDDLKIENSNKDIVEVILYAESYDDQLVTITENSNEVNINFDIENKHIILVDDVLYTGRSIRAALDAINAYGRPKSVELVTLINRKYNREVPIQPDYTGEDIDTRAYDYVKVDWKDDQCRVWIITDKTE